MEDSLTVNGEYFGIAEVLEECGAHTTPEDRRDNILKPLQWHTHHRMHGVFAELKCAGIE